MMPTTTPLPSKPVVALKLSALVHSIDRSSRGRRPGVTWRESSGWAAAKASTPPGSR
jgi:hypothetical protein